MHIAEVDLNYTQFSPLSEPYISLYPQKAATEENSEDGPKTDSLPKPPIWTEVEKCMEKGTLNKLRNRAGEISVTKSKPLEVRPSKPKPQAAPQPDTSGLNRRERRSQQRAQDGGNKKGKNKSMGFEKNAIFGASQNVQRNDQADDDGDSDGGFFEA